MQITATIIPIFLVVLLGWIIRRRGFLPDGFLEPANRLVYYFTLPPMVFMAIAKTKFRDGFDPLVIALTLTAVLLIYLIAWAATRVWRIKRSRRGSFIQCAGHGNLGYIGLAVAFYFLGETGLAKASVIAGFIMVLQNILSVMALHLYGPASEEQRTGAATFKRYIGQLAGNPIIIAVILALPVSAAGFDIPIIIRRTFTIISGLALPTALLIIGASLSMDQIRRHTVTALGASALKLMVLPGLGFIIYRLFRIDSASFLPGLILLAAPSATVSYVMARELKGDPDLAAATISATTLLSAVTLIIWLHMAAA